MNPILFMHIPKCAGSSFNATLQEVYGADHLSLTPHGRAYPTEFNGAKALSGHIMMDHPIYKERRDFIHLTILREPVERVIDAFHYLLESEIHPYHEMALRTTLEDAVSTKDRTWGLTNLMTWHLSGLTSRQADDWMRLELAKHNLKKFDLFGFVDRYPEFIAECNERFCWNAREKKVNMTEMDPRYSNGVLETIINKNALDMELYDYAKRLKYGSK